MTIDVQIKDRVRLNVNSDKETYHVVLDLSNSDLTYSVGDCVAVYPHNDPELVSAILGHFCSKGDEIVTDRKGDSYTFEDFLTRKANLLRSPKALGNGEHVLASLIMRSDLDPQSFSHLLSPLLPRFYSIASSMDVVGKEMHLTVVINENPPNFPIRFGTCSHYLCKRAPLFEPCITIYLQKAKHFYLSPESFKKPIIMIGPGTGIAPFRGFMQERILKGAHENWLFFGERREKFDYYYKDEWQKAIENGQLKMDTAFSRDGANKAYVQHRMLDKSRELWDWLERGSYLFVCGDAEKMAKEVDETLHTIIEREGQIDPKSYIKNLKTHSRYLRDIY